MRIVFMLVCFLISAFGSTVRGEPSFDCAKAKTPAEQWICMDEGPPAGSDVPWYDVEIAKLYREALRSVAPADIIELGNSQRVFLDAREGCVGKTIDCMLGLHVRRVRELVTAMPGVARYETFRRPTVKGDNGDVGGGAIRMITIGNRVDIALDALSAWGNGGNYCGFAAGDLKRRSLSSEIVWTGQLRWPNESPDVEKRTCKVVFRPNGNTIEVVSDGCYETESACGHNAWISGVYARRDEDYSK